MIRYKNNYSLKKIDYFFFFYKIILGDFYEKFNYY